MLIIIIVIIIIIIICSSSSISSSSSQNIIKIPKASVEPLNLFKPSHVYNISRSLHSLLCNCCRSVEIALP